MDKIEGEVIQTILIKLKQNKKASMLKKKGGIEKKENKRETEQ